MKFNSRWIKAGYPDLHMILDLCHVCGEIPVWKGSPGKLSAQCLNCGEGTTQLPTITDVMVAWNRRQRYEDKVTGQR